MRWDRLFAELEAQVEDDDLLERDALVEELTGGDWAETDWTELMAGRVRLDVRGAGTVEGEVVTATDRLLRIRIDAGELVVAVSAVLGAQTSGDRRRADPGPVLSRLGWPHVLRQAADDAEDVALYRDDGSLVTGLVEVVGRDFVRLRSDGDRRTLVPLARIATLRSR